jgi:ElaB/YqjD/DUF883 family membrane-anchored ribosome-binding protein
MMKSVLALATVALVVLVLEEKARQVAGEARDAYGVVVDQAQEATETLSHRVRHKPYASLLAAGACGYVLALLFPRRGSAR